MFDILHLIVFSNGQQFYNKKVRDLCEELGINKHFFLHTTLRKMVRLRLFIRLSIIL